jgi:hypothetical protein
VVSSGALRGALGNGEGDMEVIMYIGVGLFVSGLVMSHVVLGLSRRPKREGRKLSTSLKVLMWSSVGLTVLGLVLGGVAVLLG